MSRSLSRRLNLKDALKPICALCRKEVDRMEVLSDPRCPAAWNTSVVMVYCHNKRRECRIKDGILYSTSIHRGIAFLDELSNRLPEYEVNKRIKEIEYQFKVEGEHEKK